MYLRQVVWLVAAAWGVGCAESGQAGTPQGGGDGTPQIGLRRGSRWSVLSVKPPYLNGPQFHFLLKNRVLTGSVSGGTAPAGNLRVNIEPGGAEGFGPLGPVAMDFIHDTDSTVADGVWNGGRVHIIFKKDSINGTVQTNSFFHGKTDPSAARGMESFRASELNRTTRNSPGFDLADPLPQNVSCQYFLTEVSEDGALQGGSICAGMPQQTRLEVPTVAEVWLTRPELVTILVAVLSSPPAVQAEEFGPKYVPPPTEAPSRRR